MRREYVESVRKKSFLFGLVATPLMMLALVFLPYLTSEMLINADFTLVVLDETGSYGDELVAAFAEETKGFRPTVELATPSPNATAILDERLRDEEISGWIRIPNDFDSSGSFEFHSESVTNLAALESLEKRLNRLLANRRAVAAGISSEQIESLLRPVAMKTFRTGYDGGRETNFTTVYLHATALVMVLFLALIPTGQILMRSVIEEKSNRVIEVLLSSVTPQELMAGKILGLGGVGLTLLGVWTAVGLLLWLKMGSSFPVSGREVGMFVLYFFPGYLLYAALLGTIGSICSSEREAQPFLTPVSLTLLLPSVLGVAIAQNPDHLFARLMSFVPFFTPSLMLFRFTIKEPPTWEIIATWTTLVLGTIAMFWVAARIFRVGILLTGKRPSLPEVFRWVGVR
jgi:ABC-2 type transport system permease protein